jgi:hypothetical protein
MNTLSQLHRSVLSAFLRLSRRSRPASLEALLDRIDASEAALALALLELHVAGLVELRRDGAPRLQLAGLAVAVACAAAQGRERGSLCERRVSSASRHARRAKSSLSRAA